MTGNGAHSAGALSDRAAPSGEAARPLHGPGLRGEDRRARPGARLARAPGLPGRRRPPRGRARLEGLRHRDAALQLRRHPGRVPPPALPGRPAREPPGARRGLARFVVQHRRQLRDEHQLAGLRRRDDDELPHPDAGPHRPELRLGGRRDGDRRRVHPRPRAPVGRDHRQFLGRPDADHAVHPAPAVLRCWPCCSCPRAWSRPSARTRRSRSRSRASTTCPRPTRTASRSSTTRASRRRRRRR